MAATIKHTDSNFTGMHVTHIYTLFSILIINFRRNCKQLHMDHMWELNRLFCNSLEIMLEMLTKVPRDKDVINTAVAFGVIMWVVRGQHSSL